MIYESLDGKIYKDKEEVFKAIMEHLQYKFNISGNFDNWTEEDHLLYVCTQCMVDYDRSLIGSKTKKE